VSACSLPLLSHLGSSAVLHNLCCNAEPQMHIRMRAVLPLLLPVLLPLLLLLLTLR
jgi:hypothetical protein